MAPGALLSLSPKLVMKTETLWTALYWSQTGRWSSGGSPRLVAPFCERTATRESSSPPPQRTGHTNMIVGCYLVMIISLGLIVQEVQRYE